MKEMPLVAHLLSIERNAEAEMLPAFRDLAPDGFGVHALVVESSVPQTE